jgi:signal transduction histidine kinase/response regulator RpfG family c-di-GMP phosphodiesterase
VQTSRVRSQTGNKPKLLVIDDEPDNLDLLYRTFYREYKVLRAESGPEAIDILEKEGEVAVIISDQRMPLMSGTELLSQMVIKYPDTMRIILTGYTDVEDLVEAINSSKVFKYVTKPWDEDDLRTVVRQAVETHHLLKSRTAELRRTLRQESLLNAITQTINSALNYHQILETIVDTMGRAFEADCCILRPFQDSHIEDEWFLYSADHDGINSYADLAGTITETRSLQFIPDTQADQTTQGLAAYQAAQVQSVAIVPLIVQQDLIAVMALYRCGDRSTAWDEEEIELAKMVSDQAALAMSQVRSYERVRALAKREALVNTITAAIRSSLDPQDIFAAITQQLGDALNVDGCALSLWTEDDEFVQCVGLHIRNQFADSAKSTRASLPQSVVRIEGNPALCELIQTQRPVVVDDLSRQPDLNMVDLPLRQPTKSLLIVPLLSDGKIIGSISLRQTEHPRRWLSAEISLAQTVAAQAAIAVQQAHLYQKTRQQAQQLIELDRQKTEFFQNISHEFRTPLTLTIGPLESATSQQQPLSYDQSVIALRNCRRLLRLVNQLLDLQRLDAGRMQSSFRPCDLVEFVTQTLEPFKAYCDRKNISLHTQLTECPLIYLDLEKFDKVLYNLLSNAMKFTPSGGSITVSVQPTGTHCLLRVKDTGIGIREDQIPYLFDRFRQAEGSVNRSYEGSGLGLSLVKELVDMHGGQIAVESVYGAGTTFTVWLHTGSSHLPPEQVITIPAEVQTARAAVELSDVEMEVEAELADTENLMAEERLEIGLIAPLQVGEDGQLAESSPISTILVVDDNTDLRNYVAQILRQANYRIVTARNGSDGFAQAKKHKPDLIVTDLMMPLVSGLDMIRMIREEPTLAGTPIVLLTAKVDEETRIEGVERGADAYLAKPFNDRELLAEARNLLALKANERRVAELNKYLTESILKRFLPPSMVAKAAAGRLSLDFRPEPRMITVLFSDIVGFTEIANTLRSRRVAEMLNQYLSEMTRVIFDNGGTVDKFMGDGVLALFGAPEEVHPNEQVRRAVKAAREMKRSLAVLNTQWQAQGIMPVQFRCGIHQGTAVVGMFGGAERADYTAIGPTVNIAARIQSAAEPDCILVSAVIADYLEEEEISKRGPLNLKGVDETVLTFFVQS